jgi:penicillin-binding protein 2
LVNALIGLQEGTLTPATTYSCHGGANVGRFMKCHDHASPLDLSFAIQTSCNPYFAFALRKLLDSEGNDGFKDQYDLWYDYVRSFGFGRTLDSDFTGEQEGFIPDRAYFDRQYRERWNSPMLVSLAIGQGEIGVSMLQMANFIATIANRGHYYIPHVVKAIEGEEIDPRFREKHVVPIEKRHFETVAQAMWKAANVEGTARGAQLPGWDVCGKTGTAQNPPYTDHSTFACFAPLDNPRIALSVYVENGGFGATIALPIARLLLERYLNGEVADPAEIELYHNHLIAYPRYDRR